MSYCYLCNKKLSCEKREHIIPNAIGGHLKSQNILCSECNNRLSDIDRKLCSDLELLTNFISPKRENNKNTMPIVETICDGETFVRFADGSYRKNKNNIQFDGKTLHFNFSHTPNSEAEKIDFQILQNTLRQLAKKNNKNEEWIQEQISKALNQSAINSKESGIHHFQFIPDKSGYSFLGGLKVVLGFCAFKKVNKKYLESAVEILKKQDVNACYKIANYFNDNSQLPKNSVCHTLYLRGNNTNKVLYAVVSLYGVFNAFILLSDCYDGEEIEEVYNYDILKNTPCSYRMSYNFSLEQINNMLCEECDVTVAQQNFNQFMKFFSVKNWQNYIIKSVEQTMYSIFQRVIFNYKKLSENEYRSTYSNLFYNHLREYPNINLLEKDINGLSTIILDNIYTYNQYCYLKEVFLLVGTSTEILFSSYYKTSDEVYSQLNSYIENYRMECPEIQKLYDENKNNLAQFLINEYKKLMKSPQYQDIFHLRTTY